MRAFNMRDIDIESPDYYLPSVQAYTLVTAIEGIANRQSCRVTVFRVIAGELTACQSVVVNRKEIFILKGTPGLSRVNIDIDDCLFELRAYDRVAITSESGKEVFGLFDVFETGESSYSIKQIMGRGHTKAWRHMLDS